MPTLLATSPLAATRSKPVITASTSPRRISPAAAPSTTQLVVDPEPPELPHRQPRALQQRAAPRRPARAPAGGRRARRSRRARCRARSRRARRCCSGSSREPDGAHGLEQVRAVARRARRWRPRPRAGSPRPRRGRRPGRRRAAARTRSTAQARLRAVGRAVARRCAAASSARRVRRDRHREAVGGGDADQRRAAHGEPLDGRRGVLRARQLEHLLARGKHGLIEDVEPGRRPNARGSS